MSLFSRVFFADVSSFSVILRDIVLWRHSTTFDAIPQDAQNQIRNWSSHVHACSYKVWQRFSDFSLIYDFQRTFLFSTFLLTSREPAHPLLYPITNLEIAITFEPSVTYKWPLVRKVWCCSLWIFIFMF